MYRNLTRNELLNVSRKFNLLAKFSDLENSLADENERDLIKTWIALIAGSVDSIAIDPQTIADLELLTSLTNVDVKAEILNITKEAEAPTFTAEELNLPDSTSTQTLTLSITQSPVGTANVQIMQRYGSSKDDLTEWHAVNNFSNVKYKQDTFKAYIPETSHTVRELKVVSNQVIGMSVS